METTNGIYKSLLKDLPKTLKNLKKEGVSVEKFHGYVNSRKAYYINGRLMTDYKIVEKYPQLYILD